MQRRETRNITIGGITVALIIITLYAAALIKSNTISLLILATYIGVIPYIIGGVRYGLISFAAAAVLALIILPDKLIAGVYIAAGIYPYIKHLCESKKVFIEFILKYLWFNATLILLYIIFKEFIILGSFFSNSIGIAVLFIGLQAFFLLYDFIFTKFIMFLEDRLKRWR